MKKTIPCGTRSGIVDIPASKSCAHRLLICAALADGESRIVCDGISRDIAATADCLNALGAQITLTEENTYCVSPIRKLPRGQLELHCGESGSTLRFLLPVAGALGADAVFCMEGLLPERPHTALTEVLCLHGMHIEQKDDRLYCRGKLEAGDYRIPGDISSQFVSGLLFALPLLCGDSTLTVTGKIESSGYIAMTEDALSAFGVDNEKQGNRYLIAGNRRCHGQNATAEKDWSGAAFFLCMGALSERGITVPSMNTDSRQGDRRILQILRAFGAVVTEQNGTVTVKRAVLTGHAIDASEIPDLVPAIAALAAGAQGVTEIYNAARLRYKESDRLSSTCEMLNMLGADIKETQDGLIITGKPQLKGGEIDPHNDHRIAMAAAVAASHCIAPVTVSGAECVAKSYPRFWEDLARTEIGK